MYSQYPKEYYQAFLKVISYIIDGENKSVPMEKGMELAGDFWPRIYGELRESKACMGINAGGLLVSQTWPLLPLRADCRFTIAMIERADADRELNNRSIRLHIIFTVLSLLMSFSAIIISAISALLQAAA